LILIAVHARVIDWKALQVAWQDCCASYRPRLALRMTLFRNGHDASQALMLIEYIDESADSMSNAWQAPLLRCLDSCSVQEHVWEVIQYSDAR
jgi:hypothetical protein